MIAELASTPRLTLADYDAILAAGTEAAQTVNVFEMKVRAESERNLFAWGALVDDDARQVVVHLMMLGYARTVAMRIALQEEASRV